MAPRVLYHCPCSTTPTYLQHTAAASSSTSSSTPANSFSLPAAQSQIKPPIPSSSAYPLSSLYFCEECDSIRCSLCVTADVGSYYCPNCLFDVPAASVKTERARCARNCFTCPVCTHTLNVVPSDPKVKPDEEDDWDPMAQGASLGEPPYYLTCTVCRWDSKEVGLTFEKPTGLSLQLQRIEESATDNVEFNQLRAHFETYVRLQAPASSASERGAGTGTSAAQTAAAAAAARSSRLLRDVPSLANDPRFMPSYAGRASKSTRRAVGKHATEELRPYEALTSPDHGRDVRRYVGSEQALQEGKALGIVGRKEQNKLDFAYKQSDETMLSALSQRWNSLWDESSKVSDLRPTRVLLKTKQTKRCPSCRHIIVKPDPKATSNRFKIKLMALNYLPEIQIKSPVLLSSSSGHAGSHMSAMEERRRSVLTGGSTGSAGSASMARRRLVTGSVSGLFGMNATVNEDSLVPGRSYLYEATFSNPLDDPMTVRLAIGRHSGSVEERSGHHVKHTAEPGVSGSLTGSPSKQQQQQQQSSGSKPHWHVSPSTSTFPISAFNEAWELEDDSELLDQSFDRDDRRGFGSSGGNAGEVDDDDDDVTMSNDGDSNDDREQKRSRTDLGGNKERRRKGDGILKRKGHETTIGLECVLDKDAKGDIQFPLQVTYTYSLESDDHRNHSHHQAEDRSRARATGTGDKSSIQKSFTFWTIVHLGRVMDSSSTADAQGRSGSSIAVGVSAASGHHATTAEARRSALDKRRSIMGLGSAAAAGMNSTLRKLSEKREEGKSGSEEASTASSVQASSSLQQPSMQRESSEDSSIPRDKGNLGLALNE